MTTGRDPTGDGDSSALLAPALARAIVAVVFCGFAAVALLFVASSGKGTGWVVLAAVLLSGLLSLQYFYFCRPSTDLRSPLAYAMLAAQACLAYLPLPVFGQGWVSQPAFVAGSVLLVLPPRAAWPAYAAVVAGTGLAQALVVDVSLDVVYILANTATAGLYVYGLTRLGRLVPALHEARDELARTAVAHERLRFARDLHDLLGLRLSEIAAKGELTLRLVPRDPERARQELSEIVRIARRAVADVRAIAHLSLHSPDDETATLASMLAAAKVDLRVDPELRELPPHARTALSAVLREGVADLLRRREVERCEIVVRRPGDSVSVDLVAEVAGGEGTGSAGAGGFETLSAVVSRMAGQLAVEVQAGQRLCLRVTFPVAAQVPDRSADAPGEPRHSIPLVATKLAGAVEGDLKAPPA